jgi:Nitrous oxide-stimulated promoter
MILPISPAKKENPRVLKDLFILIKFIEVYCHDRHIDTSEPQIIDLKTHDLKELTGKIPRLCPGCQKLLAHALVKRTTCPMQPKPTCKHCPRHCYHPKYRQQIRDVMKYSGRKLVLRGRIDYLLHLFF